MIRVKLWGFSRKAFRYVSQIISVIQIKQRKIANKYLKALFMVIHLVISADKIGRVYETSKSEMD